LREHRAGCIGRTIIYHDDFQAGKWVLDSEQGAKAAFKLTCAIVTGDNNGDMRPRFWWGVWTCLQQAFPMQLLA